jgi:potassium-transporting ATPase KdpC subunit
MLNTSGSRLDPDISPANAALQVARVAHARGVSPVEIGALLQQHITGRSLGIFGEPHVNVLAEFGAAARLSKTVGRAVACQRPPIEY